MWRAQHRSRVKEGCSSPYGMVPDLTCATCNFLGDGEAAPDARTTPISLGSWRLGINLALLSRPDLVFPFTLLHASYLHQQSSVLHH